MAGARCHSCGRDVAVVKGGRLALHYVLILGRRQKCLGAGELRRQPIEEAKANARGGLR